MSRNAHWDEVYASRRPDTVSWYQPVPTLSLELIDANPRGRAARVLDVGAGASTLVDHLLQRGYETVGVADLAGDALSAVRTRLGPAADRVEWFHQDVTALRTPHPWDVWHDRALFHFLTVPAERQRYRDALLRSLAAQGEAVVATFGPEGPERCSGLPTVRYAPEALERELGPELELIESRDEVHRKPDGGEQRFVYCRFRRRPA